MAIPPRPLVIIIGGGFAGLEAAKALARAPVDVQVLDRQNHHLFQPLLYQVATAALSPADVSAPIRSVLRRQRNCAVALVDVQGVDPANRRIRLVSGWVTYDYLVLAAGATHAYFGHDQWASVAPGLKSLADATELRRRILLAFESAEYEASERARRAKLTFGIVGGGPTGVELAGAIKEIAGRTLPRDYRHIDTRTTRVLLFEGGPRLLAPFPPELSARAQRDLERMGVEVRLNATITEVTTHGVRIGEEAIAIHNVFWAAGVQASGLGRSIGVPVDRVGRVLVGPDLAVPGHPELFVVGDLANVPGPDGRPVPGVAQAALQMGRHAGRLIAREVARRAGEPAPPRPVFHYRDRGTMAVIGKARAVAAIGGLHFGGFAAWVLWSVVHILGLVGYRNRVQVALSFFWNWLIDARDARLITVPARLEVERPLAARFVPDEPSKAAP